jgi:L-proline---[L-prolyl-carrier protein] ligase
VTELGALGARDDRTAVVEPGAGRLTYAELDALASRIAGRLAALGAGAGARVAIALPRSADVIAAFWGTLRAGAAFVPLDPAAPPERNAQILVDCGVRIALVDARLADPLREAAGRAGATLDLHALGAPGLGAAIGAWAGDHRAAAVAVSDDALASVLYTSGSTGRPKGVMMTRRALAAFAAWIRDHIAPTRDDVFATHAPFHFAMSAFDLLGALPNGAALVIVPDPIRASAERVAELIERERVSIWFSGPAILTQIAKLEHGARLRGLRILAFAGEVFPIAHLRTLRGQLAGPRYLHVWGSTETNVAVVHELAPDDPLVAPPPLGRPCSHFEYGVVDERGQPVAAGSPGELVLRGAAVHAGYLNRPELTAEKRFGPWHRTGDLVIETATGELRHAGRLGRMVKVRGYRVEPGEIEARLYEHPQIVEAGVVAMPAGDELELVAHLRTASGERLAVVELKEFCAVKLPAYMVPKRFVFHAALPRNANGKIDLPKLAHAEDRDAVERGQ